MSAITQPNQCTVIKLIYGRNVLARINKNLSHSLNKKAQRIYGTICITNTKLNICCISEQICFLYG